MDRLLLRNPALFTAIGKPSHATPLAGSNLLDKEGAFERGDYMTDAGRAMIELDDASPHDVVDVDNAGQLFAGNHEQYRNGVLVEDAQCLSGERVLLNRHRPW